MRALMIAAAVAAATCFVAAPSNAQTPQQTLPQQTLMKNCNSDATAKKLTGDARRSFMSDCLSGRSAQTPQTTAQSPQATQLQRMKDCNANATSQKLSGTARRSFMSSCLSGGGTAAAPTAAPASTTAAAPAPATQASSPQQKMKDCNASATSQKLSGTARRNFMSSCLTGNTAAAPAAAPASPTASAPAAAPAPTANAPQQQPSRAARTAPASTTTGSAAGTAGAQPGQFSTEAVAQSSCGTDTVVWVNTDSHIYHFKNNANYGKTKQGAYMCERDAISAGSHAAKNEKRS